MLSVILLLSACNSQPEAPISLFQEVLRNERQFVCGWLGPAYLEESTGELGPPISIAVFDMNGDGTNEVVVNFNNTIIYVFKYYNGEIYASSFTYRIMNGIMTDGRLRLGFGRGDFGIGELIIAQGASDISLIYSFLHGWPDPRYYPNTLNDEAISDEEFEIWFASLNLKEYITWHPFTDKNIENLALLVTNRYTPNN
ncbi:MAG: hypothetical protein FWC76_04945 [Defluviitaleaceae bacterium]|nr:hypothetical protein [Defluviitaleaceae bacterium]